MTVASLPTMVLRLVLTACVMALSACANTTFSSRVIAPPQAPIKRLQIVMVANELRKAGLAVAEGRHTKMVEYGYYDMGRLLSDRAPRVLAANGLEGDVRLLPANKPGSPTPVDSITAGDATLLIEVSSLSEARQGPLMHRAYIGWRVTLLQKPENSGAKTRSLWDSLVTMRLGADEALGIGFIHRIDADSVDNLMRGFLDALARDGMLKLPTAAAVVPKG